MKNTLQNWRLLALFLVIGLAGARYLLAQTPASPANSPDPHAADNSSPAKIAPPDAREAADSERLIDAINAGDSGTALEILHTYGVADNTLVAMSANLGKVPSPVQLPEPFLKISVGALATGDLVTKSNLLVNLRSYLAANGYDRPVWAPHRQDTTPVAHYSGDLLEAPSEPVAQLDLKPKNACFIRSFLWCDHYVDYVHSIALNGLNLSNVRLDDKNYTQANRTLNAMFQLIKARRPDVFVWLGVVKQDNLNDEKWLNAMSFRPDGLQIWNVSQFHSPFEQTRIRYGKIMGANMPMMVADFYGYGPELEKRGEALVAAIKKHDETATDEAMHKLGAIGGLVGQDLADEETTLQSLGYRGISVRWELLMALATANTNMAAVDKSNMIDPRAGRFDTYFEEKDYSSMISLASEMISNSAPGDMDWVVAKLYSGMAYVNENPPQLNAGIKQLDDILTFNFTNRPNRDHYIIGAAEWRIYAAAFNNDTKKPRQLVQWIQKQDLQRGMKANFLKKYGKLLNGSSTTNKVTQ